MQEWDAMRTRSPEVAELQSPLRLFGRWGLSLWDYATKIAFFFLYDYEKISYNIRELFLVPSKKRENRKENE